MSCITATALALLGMLAADNALAEESADVIRLSEPVESTADTETFGVPLDETLKTVKIGMLVESSEDYLGKPVIVTARVAQVCQMKGCFLIAQDGPDTLRVSFKDYGFFVPTDISGRRVTMAAVLVQREISHEQAQHLSADLGGETAIKPGMVYELVATSVRVPRG
jgi:hypothetical protein